jgi:Uncharacterized protein conserved in bacteria (DUF2225)
MRGWFAFMIAAALAIPASAITFSNGTKPDPFAPGKTCDAPQLASYGSYVYDWPSKYDLVFSPQDYPMWIWRCEASGYVSFPREFETISDAERPRIAAYLAKAQFGPKVKADGLSDVLLQHLERVYALRDLDDEFRAYFMRYLAWQYRVKPIADEYRKKAFDIHQTMLQSGTLKGTDLAETLYILGFYSYKFGRADEAKTYFAKIKNVETIDPETNKPRRGLPYLETLAKEVLGGKADDGVRFKNDQN